MDEHCAWHDPSDNGTDGICGPCMLLYFGVDPASIHAEITAEAGQQKEQEKVAA